MKKPVKYIVIVVILVLSLYNAVYFEPLDKVKEEQSTSVFDAKTLATDFMSNNIETLPAINVSEFLADITKGVEKYCEQKGKKLGISNDYNFIIDGNATVIAIEEEDVLVAIDDDSKQQIRIATDFIFGNAIRDGSGLADIGSFQNTMDFNTISVELNNIVRETIVPPFKQKVKEGDTLYFKGAVKVNTKSPNLQALKVIPLIIKFNN
ncbi:DUF2291 family protein [Mariniflexile litorale]|uniref:DUF2291 family protein n=1 Tax=Mariniflexile litorale TaxID=3045158 RepID=A0AAU7EG00_9FLAO|nr:DUF2291 family protein [Mariniflexile sp. KMM 9835]MDQ8211720.1 DUF2291 family protein [Mariniflexile sp. KMM 9835]